MKTFIILRSATGSTQYVGGRQRNRSVLYIERPCQIMQLGGSVPGRVALIYLAGYITLIDD